MHFLSDSIVLSSFGSKQLMDSGFLSKVLMSFETILDLFRLVDTRWRGCSVTFMFCLKRILHRGLFGLNSLMSLRFTFFCFKLFGLSLTLFFVFRGEHNLGLSAQLCAI